VIRFSASLVVVGVGLLIAGGVTSKLLLIYIAIGVSALALLFLIVGAILHRAELFGREPEGIAAGQAGHDGYADEVAAQPEPAVTTARTATAAPAATAPAATATGKTGSTRDTGSQPLHTFAGYEQFTTQAERRRPEPLREDRPSRPSQPSRPARSQPFVDPQPTRMDWAADLRQAEKQELERQERERPGQPQRPGRADVPAQNRPDRGRPDRSQPDRSQPGKPFVDPEPTRMDWAKNLREAEQQELGRQASEREAQPASPSPRRAPEPAPAEATRAERIQPPAPSAPPAQATRAERIQPPADATRAEKIITAEPDGKTPAAAKNQPAPAATPAPAPAPAATPVPARSATPGTAAARAEDKVEDQAAGKAEDQPPAAQASPAPPQRAQEDQRPQEDQPPAADSGASDSRAADQDAEAKSPADQAETAEGDPPEPSPAEETSDRGGDTSLSAVPSDQDVTVVPGVPRYHRSECILIRFMGDNDLQRMSVEQARKAGCTPCRACQPDGDEDD
jgi:hypothetical protein